MRTNSLGRFLLLLALCAPGVTAASARAGSLDDPVCKIVISAIEKSAQTPNHTNSTITRAGAAPIEAESIQTGGKLYVKVNNAWQASPVTMNDASDQIKETLRSAKIFTCRHERDEAVEGEPAAVYKTHQDSDEIKADAEIWISKSRGLILREVVDHPEDKMHITTRYDYNHVEKPAGVQ